MGRIISYSEKTGYNDGDYLLLDNGEGGTKRIRADRVGIQLDPTLTDPNKAAPANTVKPVDAVPTQGSTNAVSSGGVYSALDSNTERIESLEDDRYKLYPTDIVSGSIASFPDGADDVPMVDVTVNIDPVQDLSHGDPSPDNICPISGWTGVKVVRTGVNLWDEEWELGTIRQSDGLFASDNTRIRSKNFNPCVPETTYYVKDPTNNNNISLRWYDANKGFISSSSWIGNTTITSPVNAYYFAIVVASAYGTTYNHDISINYPSTDHDYHSFTGIDTYPITFPTEAGTVYGGTLDVTTGELVVDRAMVTLDGSNDEQWQFYNISQGALFRATEQGNPAITAAVVSLFLCSAYKLTINRLNGTLSSSNAGYLDFINNAFSDLTSWRTELASNPIQVVYPLATPIIYQLTPQEITSLLGANNLWADTGDSTVEYRADTTMYINRKIAEAVSALS